MGFSFKKGVQRFKSARASYEKYSDERSDRATKRLKKETSRLKAQNSVDKLRLQNAKLRDQRSKMYGSPLGGNALGDPFGFSKNPEKKLDTSKNKNKKGKSITINFD